MAKRANIEIGMRMHEECLRLFTGHKDTVKRLGCGHYAPYQWAQGVAPSAINMQRMALRGGDIMYILTGRRSNAVSKVQKQ